MGDFVNRKNIQQSLNYIQSTLFEPQANYNANLKGRKNFNFYTDVKYNRVIEELIKEYLE